MDNKYVVIMAGGKGERFWPRSRESLPKQFLPIIGDKPMLKQTIERLQGLVPICNIFVITNESHRSIVIDICPELDSKKIIGEPIGRDTAPAVALATMLILRENPKAIFAMLPADAVIKNNHEFKSVLDAAFLLAEKNNFLVTIGISPSFPATGYGYIHKSEFIKKSKDHKAYNVSSFKEKPTLERAKYYLDTGGYYWNAGIFIWKASDIKDLLEQYCKKLWSKILNIKIALDKGQSLNIALEDIYPTLEKISIDYAIIEKANNIVMLEATFEWDDVGDWCAIQRHKKLDLMNNCCEGNTIALNVKNSILINNNSNHVVATLGIEDLVVVHTKDATLVCKKDDTQSIKKLVNLLAENPVNIKHT